MTGECEITSLANPKVKYVVKLRQRSHRDETGEMIAEGYREIKRALDHGYVPTRLFYCNELFLKGTNEPKIIERARELGAEVYSCTAPVFEKMAYRERPEGLLATGPQPSSSLVKLSTGLSPSALVIVAEAIEKPGNLGTILRSADAAGADAVIVCDRCTDIYNPNVVRASTGVIFSMPVVECTSEECLGFLRTHGFGVLAATPHGKKLHFEADMTGRTAIVVGNEQYGLSRKWLGDSLGTPVRIPMLGNADSLNVSAATTILLFEAIRQRILSGAATPPEPLPEEHDA